MDSRSIRPHDSSAEATNPSIMIAMTVTGDHHFPRPSITLLDDDLVPDAASCRVKINVVFPGKGLDLVVFG